MERSSKVTRPRCPRTRNCRSRVQLARRACDRGRAVVVITPRSPEAVSVLCLQCWTGMRWYRAHAVGSRPRRRSALHGRHLAGSSERQPSAMSCVRRAVSAPAAARTRAEGRVRQRETAHAGVWSTRSSSIAAIGTARCQPLQQPRSVTAGKTHACSLAVRDGQAEHAAGRTRSGHRIHDAGQRTTSRRQCRASADHPPREDTESVTPSQQRSARRRAA